jgi:uncharacterized protein YecT (DUF1311 family)
MKRIFAFLFLACLVGCQQPLQHKGSAKTETADAELTPWTELQRLTAALDAAESQTDMNLASKKISEFWDAKLTSVENRIEEKLDKQQQKRFSAASGLWRRYRTDEVKFHADVFSGGSTQPLIANESYSQITQLRVAELEAILVDSHLETQ